MERSDVITTLEVLKANCPKYLRDYHALDYAISSLKTDEAYQIMYEGGEIYTKADLVAMLEDLDLQIDESAACNLEVAKVQRLIRDRINALKESK